MRTIAETLDELKRWRAASEARIAEIRRQWGTRDIDDPDTLRFSIREHARLATLEAAIAFIEGIEVPRPGQPRAEA